MSSRLHVVLFVSLLCFGALATHLSAQSPVAQSEEEIVFKSHTELVTVPVIVTNKSGAHVHSLTKEDFELTQDGVPQKIATFEEVIKPEDLHFASTLAPDRFTNVVTSEAKPLNLTILVVDLLNTPITDQANARNALTK